MIVCLDVQPRCKTLALAHVGRSSSPILMESATCRDLVAQFDHEKNQLIWKLMCALLYYGRPGTTAVVHWNRRAVDPPRRHFSTKAALLRANSTNGTNEEKSAFCWKDTCATSLSSRSLHNIMELNVPGCTCAVDKTDILTALNVLRVERCHSGLWCF